MRKTGSGILGSVLHTGGVNDGLRFDFFIEGWMGEADLGLDRRYTVTIEETCADFRVSGHGELLQIFQTSHKRRYFAVKSLLV